MASHLRMAAAGALGGAANAWLCYAQLPVAAAGHTGFKWHVVPAGAVHGGLLAWIAFSAGALFTKRGWTVRLFAALPVAWIAGAASWIPLNRSAFDEPWLKSVTWPFHEGLTSAAIGPLQCFGLVAGLYYLFAVFGPATRRSLLIQVLAAGACGVLGSLWWWVTVESWYLSPLHGSIWGTLVGVAAWHEVRSDATLAPGVA